MNNVYKKEYLKLERKMLNNYKIFILFLTIILVLLSGIFYLNNKNDKLENKVNNYEVELQELKAQNRQYKDGERGYRAFLAYQGLLLSRDYENRLDSVVEKLNNMFYIDDIPLTLNQQEYIYRVADKYDIPYEIFMSLIELESNFKIDAINYNTNGTIDYGVCQINSANIEWLNNEFGRELDLMNFYDNIEAGAFIFNSFRQNTLKHTILSYNRGISGANSYYRKYGTYEHAYTKLVLGKVEKYKESTND